MKFIKDFLYDFKYMDKQSKMQYIITTFVIIAAIIGAGFFFVNIKKDKEETKVDLNLNNYVVYSYQENGDISVVNLNENKTLSKVSIGDIKKLISENEESLNSSFANPYKLIEKDSKIYALDFNGNIVEYQYTQKDIKEINRIATDKLPIDFKLIENQAYVSYLNSNKIDVINLSTKEKVRSFELESEVRSFELVDSHLYVGTKAGIEILNTTNISEKNIIKLDEESVTSKIFVSEFEEDLVINEINENKNTSKVDENKESQTKNKELESNEKKDTVKASKKVKTVYVLNNFASDNKSSIVIKLQEGKPVDLVELKKENPIDITETEKFLYVACKGLEEHTESDNVIVINKNNFKLKNKISTSDKPNTISHLDKEIVFVGHDSGEITRINLENEEIEAVYTVPETKGLVVKKYAK